MLATVGRARELREVMQSLADPRAAITLLVGDAGIGKSRMVTEAVTAGPQTLAMVGACLPMRHSMPLLPVIDALDSRDPDMRRSLTRAVRAIPEVLRPHIAGVMPRTSPEDLQPAGEVRRDQLFWAIEALLSRVAEERPTTLVIEGVHWADPDTRDMVTYLAGVRRSAALHLLVTCQADETRMSEPVTEWLEQMSIFSLRWCTPAVRETPSSPSSWLPRPAAGERLPERLARLLSARVRTVSPAARGTITALAVVGRPIPLDAVRIVTRQDEEGCLAAVRELEAASLVVRDSSRLRPRHALLAEALLDELPGLSSSYHRRVATALLSLGDAATAPELADHLRRAGDEKAELPAALLAAQRAWNLGAYADAAGRYRRVAGLRARHPDHELTMTDTELARRTIRVLDLGGARRETTELAERAWVVFSGWSDRPERLKLLGMCAHLAMVEEPDRSEQMLEAFIPDPNDANARLTTADDAPRSTQCESRLRNASQRTLGSRVDSWIRCRDTKMSYDMRRGRSPRRLGDRLPRLPTPDAQSNAVS